MTWYELFLWIHMMMAIVWVGGGVTIQVFALRIVRSGDAARITGFAKDVEVIGMRLFTPSSLLLFLSGVGLIENGNWSWSEPFVSIGLAVFALSAVAGAGFLGPESGRIAKAVEAGGPASPEAQRRIRRILAYSRVELLLLLVVVFMMTVKLGT